jgi:K+-sensing histidine kinase KdpD
VGLGGSSSTAAGAAKPHLECGQTRGQEIAVTAYTKGDFVVVEVIDDGPGLPPEVEARMFQGCVHSNGAALVEGSVGLGLVIARSFVERMGGSLVYARTDGLTIFAIHLPQAAEPVGSQEPELEAILA